MLPLKLLNDKSSCVSDLRLHMDEDISPDNELSETLKVCSVSFFHNHSGSVVILLFDNRRISSSAKSFINVGISTKLHAANCKI